jgi:hypothetical protein
MTTVRQIERAWAGKAYERLFRELVAFRPEAAFPFDLDTNRPAIAAAMAMIRLEELSQSHVPLYGTLLRAVLAAQDADGGWGDAVTTALCLRALLSDHGDGMALDRGLSYLAELQKPEGVWPAGSLRRMPADAHVSAFVLYQLGDSFHFREAVRFLDALDWFEVNEATLDAPARRLWEIADLRCHLCPAVTPEPAYAAAWG